MKVKSFVVAGLVAATLSPAMAAKETKRDLKKELERIELEKSKLDGAMKIPGFADDAQKQAIGAFWADVLTSRFDETNKKLCDKEEGFFVKEGDEFRCVPKNPCKSKDAADAKYCVKAFKKVQVGTKETAGQIVQIYVENVLKWGECANFVVPKSKAAGQDYITCVNPKTAEPRVFEFDDMSESNNALALRNQIYGLCVAFGGKADFPKKGDAELECSKIGADACASISTISKSAFDGKKCYIRL